MGDAKDVPTLWLANKYFSRSVRAITEDQKTGLVTLTINWTNPAQAAEWANGLVVLTNSYLRDRAISTSERNISYLNEVASKTGEIGLKSAVYSLMEAEIKNEMLARGNLEYALKVIDPAVVPERKSSLSRLLWVAAGAFAGMVLSILVLAVRGLAKPES